MIFSRFFKKRKPSQGVFRLPDKIEVFGRYCFFSSISQHKLRLPGFSREVCYENLIKTMDLSQANFTCFLDTAKGPKERHFLVNERRFPVIEAQAGTEAGAFLRLLAVVLDLPLDPETIVYFVEDDYLHREGWVKVLKEAFQIPGVEYATLYDHKDKYFWPMYQNLTAKIFVTPTCHWRSTPSTTHTFATRFKTLKRDESIHRKFSENRLISADHQKFLALQKRGALLVSPMPGYSTHVDTDFASPCVDWGRYIMTVQKELIDSSRSK